MSMAWIALAAAMALLPAMRCAAQFEPWTLSIPPNPRGDNALQCNYRVADFEPCPGGWLGLYVDRDGNKHVDAFYRTLSAALRGEVAAGDFARWRPPAYGTFSHPKFRCARRLGCATAGWAM